MASLREVARRAGVSVATASRVANGSYAVQPATRERVERAMRDLLYVPPARRSETGLIGVLVPELANPIFPALAQAIETRAAPDGLASILCNTREAAFREIDYVHMLLDRRVEGMIFISCEMTNLRGDHTVYLRLADEGARIVFVNGAIHTLDVPSVGVDERAAGEIATQHLLDLGHERIGFVAGPEHYLPTQLKAAGRSTRARGCRPRRRRRPDGPRGLQHRGRRPRARRAPRAAVAADGRHLLERHDGDRRAPRRRAPRRQRAEGAVHRRLRRHRRDEVDRSRADDGRAADRADRGHRRRRRCRRSSSSRAARCRARTSGPSCTCAARPLRRPAPGRASGSHARTDSGYVCC